MGKQERKRRAGALKTGPQPTEKYGHHEQSESRKYRWEGHRGESYNKKLKARAKKKAGNKSRKRNRA